MRKLLIIDDDIFYHRILSLMLNKYQFFSSVGYSFNAAEVLASLKLHRCEANELPDIIITDLSMPVMTGWEFVDELNVIYNSLAKKIDVYISSSSIDSADLDRCKKYPFVKAYFVKPITKGILMRIV